MHIDYELDVANVVTKDGHRLSSSLNSPQPPTRIVSASVWPSRYEMQLTLRDMDAPIVVELQGAPHSTKDRPIVYLDQNVWIRLAQALHRPDALAEEEVAACRSLVELAEGLAVILPISTQHLTESIMLRGDQRDQVVGLMARLSRGWTMVHPVRVRRHELSYVLASQPVEAVSPFSLDRQLIMYPPRDEPTSNPHVTGQAAVVQDLSATSALYATILGDDLPREGRDIAERWAEGLQHTTDLIAGDRPPPETRRKITLLRYVEDLDTDFLGSAFSVGLTSATIPTWFAAEGEETFRQAPYLGLAREVFHTLLSNRDTKWEANDLNDIVYLTCAAAYADFVVCEKHMAHQVRQASRSLPNSYTIPFTKVADLIDSLSPVNSTPRLP
jgi:hypothetical protein